MARIFTLLGEAEAAVVVSAPPHDAIDMSGEAKVRLRTADHGTEIAAFGLDLERHGHIGVHGHLAVRVATAVEIGD